MGKFESIVLKVVPTVSYFVVYPEVVKIVSHRDMRRFLISLGLRPGAPEDFQTFAGSECSDNYAAADINFVVWTDTAYSIGRFNHMMSMPTNGEEECRTRGYMLVVPNSHATGTDSLDNRYLGHPILCTRDRIWPFY